MHRQIVVLRESCATLGQGLVTSVSEESLDDYANQVMPSWFRNPEPPLDPGLVERVEHYIRSGLELLDAVPRDHPFWEKTNKNSEGNCLQDGPVVRAGPASQSR